jgi:hypothetical protein
MLASIHGAFSVREFTVHRLLDDSFSQMEHRPPRFRIEIGTRTVMVRPSRLIFGFDITLPPALA